MTAHVSRYAVLLAALAAMPALAAAPHAAAGHYRIDPASHIGFHVAQVGGGGIAGAIRTVSGSFDIDPANLTRSSVAVDLQPASVATGQPRIDAFLRSSAVFDASEHPTISFRSTRVVQTGPKTATIEGVLTARGQSRNETFHATLTEEGAGKVGFHVTGDVFRTPYGMGVGTPIYSNVVSFDMQLEGTR